MLHHANVDRLIALWQAIYYDSSMFNNSDWQTALFATPAGEVDANSPLKPFYDQNGDFHTSNGVRNISTFGYTYPELVNETWLSQEDLSRYVKYMVNSLYSDEKVSSTSSRFRNKGHFRRQSPVGKKYSIEVQIEKSEVPLPATVDCYIAGNIVGKMALLAMPQQGLSHASIPLSVPLSAANVDLEGVDIVVPYLNDKLSCEVRQVSRFCSIIRHLFL